MDWRQQTESHRLELVINWDQGPCRGKVWSDAMHRLSLLWFHFECFSQKLSNLAELYVLFCVFSSHHCFNLFNRARASKFKSFYSALSKHMVDASGFLSRSRLEQVWSLFIKIKNYCFQFFISARLSLFHWRVIRRTISPEDLFSFMPSRKRGLPWFHEGLAFLS